MVPRGGESPFENQDRKTQAKRDSVGDDHVQAVRHESGNEPEQRARLKVPAQSPTEVTKAGCVSAIMTRLRESCFRCRSASIQGRLATKVDHSVMARAEQSEIVHAVAAALA